MNTKPPNPTPPNFASLMSITTRISFTPTKQPPKVPHIWDRKPSTPFIKTTRPKPRKLWKRFRSSFGSMKEQQELKRIRSNGYEEEEEEDLLRAEINGARNWGFMRGVKRLCLGLGSGVEGEGEGEGGRGGFGRGQSFLETKWEEGVTRKRRKLPFGTSGKVAHVNERVSEDSTIPTEDSIENNVHDPADPLCDETTELEAHTENPQHGQSPSEETTRVDEKGSSLATADNEAPPQATNHVPESPKLVRSALRSSLDREDTELLNAFVSKAVMKRVAKAAVAAKNPENPVEPEHNRENTVSEIPTPPPTRRVLEDIDTNSPSPLRPQSSPSKTGRNDSTATTEEPKTNEFANSCADEQPTPASPNVRRSSRARTPRQPPRITPPSVRGATTISLRRPKGTEFVFQQRTEEQETALATKKNTKQNKGGAMLPEKALKIMAKEQWCPEMDMDRGAPTSRRRRSSSKRGQKHVSWNEQRLAQYEGEEYSDDDREEDSIDESGNDMLGGKDTGVTLEQGRGTKRTNAGGSAKDSHDANNTNARAPAPPTPPATRRVRRIAPSSSSSASAPLSNTPATTTPRRKTITPKPPSKKTTAVTAAAVKKGTKPTPASNSVGAKTHLASNAGSTPAPKRFRARC